MVYLSIFKRASTSRTNGNSPSIDIPPVRAAARADFEPEELGAFRPELLLLSFPLEGLSRARSQIFLT
jgi:hypothetical protein